MYAIYHFLLRTVPTPTVITSKANSTTVRVDVALDGGSFDSAKVSFSPALADQQTFSDKDLPVFLAGLTSGVDYNLTFVFGVGALPTVGILEISTAAPL